MELEWTPADATQLSVYSMFLASKYWCKKSLVCKRLFSIQQEENGIVRFFKEWIKNENKYKWAINFYNEENN